MPTKATYTFFPRLHGKSFKHDVYHKPCIGSSHQRHSLGATSTRRIEATSLQSLRLYTIPDRSLLSSACNDDNKVHGLPLPPDSEISPMTLTAKPVDLLKTIVPSTLRKEAITILDVSTLNEATDMNARYKETAIIPRTQRPSLRPFSRRNQKVARQHAALLHNFSFPAHQGEDKEYATIHNCDLTGCEEGMVSPRTQDVAAFWNMNMIDAHGFGRREGRTTQIVVARRIVQKKGATSKLSQWEEYDADDECGGQEEGTEGIEVINEIDAGFGRVQLK